MLKIGDRLNWETITHIIHRHSIFNIIIFFILFFSGAITIYGGIVWYHFISIILIVYWQIIFWILYFLMLWNLTWNIIISNNKIICIYKKTIFSKEFIEIPFNEIFEIKWEQKGFFQSMFWYGTIIITLKWTYQIIKIDFLSNIIENIYALELEKKWKKIKLTS